MEGKSFPEIGEWEEGILMHKPGRVVEEDPP